MVTLTHYLQLTLDFGPFISLPPRPRDLVRLLALSCALDLIANTALLPIKLTGDWVLCQQDAAFLCLASNPLSPIRSAPIRQMLVSIPAQVPPQSQ